MIDLLAPRPIGMTAFMLLIGRRRRGHRPGARPCAVCGLPIIAVFLTSMLTSTLYLVSMARSRAPIPVADPVAAMLPTALYSTAVAAVVGPIAIALRRRSAERERVAW